jgi:hypothetical protein
MLANGVSGALDNTPATVLGINVSGVKIASERAHLQAREINWYVSGKDENSA